MAAIDAEHGLVGADGHRRRHHAVEHEVRGEREQRHVLEAQRFALSAVGDDDRGAAPADRAPARRAGDGFELDAGREAGAAPTAQARLGDGCDKPVAVAGAERREGSEAIEMGGQEAWRAGWEGDGG